MSIKGIVSAVIASTALLTGLTSYTSAVYSNKLEQFVSQQNKNAGIDIQIINRTNGFFSRDQTYQITLSAQFINDKIAKVVTEQPITLFIAQHFVAYPLYVVNDLSIDQTKGTPGQWLQTLKIENIPHQIQLTTNLVLQASTLDVALLPYSYNQDNNIVTHQGIELTATTDLQFTTGDITINIGEANAKLANDIEFKLNQFHSDSTFEKYHDSYLFTNSNARLQQAKFSDKVKDITMEINDLITKSTMSSMDDNQFSMAITLDIGSLKTANAVDSYDISKTEVAFTAVDLDKDAYLAIDKLSRQVQPDKQTLFLAFAELIKTGGQATLSKFNFNLNQVQFNSDAEFSLPNFKGSLAVADLDQYFIANFDLKVNLAMTNSYSEQLSQIKPMVDHFINQGFIKTDEQGNISSTVTFKQGQLTANDKPLQM